MLKPLICTQCGAQLKYDESKVFFADDVAIIIGVGTVLKCDHCGTQFQSGEQIPMTIESVTFNQAGQTVGMQVNVSGGQIGVIGNNLRVGKISFN